MNTRKMATYVPPHTLVKEARSMARFMATCAIDQEECGRYSTARDYMTASDMLRLLARYIDNINGGPSNE